jgi:hypothetical protein
MSLSLASYEETILLVCYRPQRRFSIDDRTRGPKYSCRRRQLTQLQIITHPGPFYLISTAILGFPQINFGLPLSLPPGTDFLTDPRREVEVPSTGKNSTPEDELSGIDDHTKDIELGLEDCWKVSHKKIRTVDRRENPQTDMRENTSPAASIPTKIKEIPRTVRWTWIS